MSNSRTASPNFAEQLGQLAKFIRVMGFKPEEIQVVINDRNARNQVGRTWSKVINPPAVRLVRHMFAGTFLPLTELHALARKLELDMLLSSMSTLQRSVFDMLLGLTRDEAMPVERVASELNIREHEVLEMQRAALTHLRRHVEERDLDIAQRLPLAATDLLHFRRQVMSP